MLLFARGVVGDLAWKRESVFSILRTNFSRLILIVDGKYSKIGRQCTAAFPLSPVVLNPVVTRGVFVIVHTFYLSAFRRDRECLRSPNELQLILARGRSTRISRSLGRLPKNRGGTCEREGERRAITPVKTSRDRSRTLRDGARCPSVKFSRARAGNEPSFSTSGAAASRTAPSVSRVTLSASSPLFGHRRRQSRSNLCEMDFTRTAWPDSVETRLKRKSRSRKYSSSASRTIAPNPVAKREIRNTRANVFAWVVDRVTRVGGLSNATRS